MIVRSSHGMKVASSSTAESGCTRRASLKISNATQNLLSHQYKGESTSCCNQNYTASEHLLQTGPSWTEDAARMTHGHQRRQTQCRPASCSCGSEFHQDLQRCCGRVLK